jgi:hypothetical protein
VGYFQESPSTSSGQALRLPLRAGPRHIYLDTFVVWQEWGSTGKYRNGPTGCHGGCGGMEDIY